MGQIKPHYSVMWLQKTSVCSKISRWPWNEIAMITQSSINVSTLNTVTLTSVCIFSILFAKHVLCCWLGEFVEQSKLLRLVIISFILMILMNDSEVLLLGEIRCWSLTGFKVSQGQNESIATALVTMSGVHDLMLK